MNGINDLIYSSNNQDVNDVQMINSKISRMIDSDSYNRITNLIQKYKVDQYSMLDIYMNKVGGSRKMIRINLDNNHLEMKQKKKKKTMQFQMGQRQY